MCIHLIWGESENDCVSSSACICVYVVHIFVFV